MSQSHTTYLLMAPIGTDRELWQPQDNKSKIQVKSQISLSHPDCCKTRKDAKYYITKQKHKKPTNERSKMDKQQQSHHLKGTAAKATWGN